MTASTQPVRSASALRIVLTGLGAIDAFVAVNVAFGGIETLGLQGPTKWFQVTDHADYLIRDSHARFYGGVYLAMALFLIVAGTDLRKYRTTLNVIFAAIFMGGLARLTQMEPGVTFGPALTVSSIVELVGMPALAYWLAVATKPRVARVVPTAVASPVAA